METDLRIRTDIVRQEPFNIQVDGEPVLAYPGETIATALLAVGLNTFHSSTINGEPRGMYCGMGLCHECLVTVNGQPNVRACVTIAQPGDIIKRQI